MGSLIFPVDFIILNFDTDPEVLFIFGRPFLETGHALIDVSFGQLTTQTPDKVEVFDVHKVMKFLAISEELLPIQL